jgi:hypothetical protein
VALLAARPLNFFYLALYPFNRILNFAARWLLQKIGIEPDGQAEGIAFGGGIAPGDCLGVRRSRGGHNLVLNALDLRRRTVREVMRPRHEITVFNTDAAMAECLATGGSARGIHAFRFATAAIWTGRWASSTSRTLYALAATRRRSGGGFAARGAQADLRPGNRAAGKIAASGFWNGNCISPSSWTNTAARSASSLWKTRIEALVGQIQDEFDSGKTRAGAHQRQPVWEAAGTLPLHELEKIIGEVDA